MSDDRNSPELASVIKLFLDNALREVNVALPARVNSYDPAAGTVNVQPTVQVGFRDEAGARGVEDIPVITDVPVLFPGAGNFRITFPIVKGDTILLIVPSQSIDRWMQETKNNVTTDPADDRRHSLEDAIAIPGLRRSVNQFTDTPSITHMSIGKDGGATASFDDNEIRLGSDSASDRVALASELAAFRTAYNTHVHPVTGNPTGTTTAPVGSMPGATKVKAE